MKNSCEKFAAYVYENDGTVWDCRGCDTFLMYYKGWFICNGEGEVKC